MPVRQVEGSVVQNFLSTFSSPCFWVKTIQNYGHHVLRYRVLAANFHGVWAPAQQSRSSVLLYSLCTTKRGLESCPKIHGVWHVINEHNWVWRKLFITKANAASGLSRCSAPSQPLLKPTSLERNSFKTLASGWQGSYSIVEASVLGLNLPPWFLSAWHLFGNYGFQHLSMWAIYVLHLRSWSRIWT
jgi:hypothetical protein